MRAIAQHRYGGPGAVLALQDVDQPVVGDGGPDQGSGGLVNPADVHFITGKPIIVR